MDLHAYQGAYPRSPVPDHKRPISEEVNERL